VTRPMAGGRRRVDRVLAPDFLQGLSEISLTDLRERRKDAEQEEADLSYLRRMLHGRMDIVAAELRHRSSSAEAATLVEELSIILGDEQRSTRGSGRHITVQPSRMGETRRDVEQAVSDSITSDVQARSEGELILVLEMLRGHEKVVSDTRREVQQAMDALSAELTSRYRDGSASVDALIPRETSD